MDNPVDFGDVKTTSGDVGTEEDTGRGITELEECICALLLFLFALRGRQQGRRTGISKLYAS